VNRPDPLYILFGAVMGGLSVAVMIVTFDLEPGRLAMYGLMGFGLLVTVSARPPSSLLQGRGTLAHPARMSSTIRVSERISRSSLFKKPLTPRISRRRCS
jgi:hypothetical protein